MPQKKLPTLLLFSALLGPLASHATSPARDFRIVSDYDDTLKVANVSGPKWDVVRRSLLSESFYAGMSTLFAVWAEATSLPASPLHILSASPRQLSRRIRSDLREKGFPSSELTLRDWSREKDTRAFKLGALRRHLAHDQALLLIGDDTQHDSEVYATFAKQKRVLATYIRRVTGAPIARGQMSFVTAYDIAAHEYSSGRLQTWEALEVASAVLRSSSKHLKPQFVRCTALRSSCLGLRLPGPLARACQDIQARVDLLCSRSKK
jgi:phosphatidate phosphatase APP1